MQLFIADLFEIIKKKDIESVLSHPDCKADLARCRQMKSDKRRQEFLVGRWLIQQVLGNDFSVQSSGALYSEKCFLSLAHSGGWVVLAISDHPVGVDIEDCSRVRDFKQLAKAQGFSEPKTALDFYRDFTRYEADFKLGQRGGQHLFYQWNDFLICVANKMVESDLVIEQVGADGVRTQLSLLPILIEQ